MESKYSNPDFNSSSYIDFKSLFSSSISRKLAPVVILQLGVELGLGLIRIHS